MIVKLLFILIISLCCLGKAAELPGVPGKAPELPRVLPTTAAEDRRQVNCKMDICFAIEGSNMLPPHLFNLQKNFVANLVRGFNAISNSNQIRYAAVQYGLIPLPISFLTSDTTSFLRDLRNTRFANSIANFVAGGIVFCHRDLLPTPDSNSVTILIGTGRSNFGSDPTVIAGTFRGQGGKILSVGIGRIGGIDKAALLGIAGKGSNRFFLSQRRINRVRTRVLNKLELELCGQ